MITFVFSMDGPVLSDEQKEVFRAYAEWKVVNQRAGRLLVDGIGQQADLATALDALAVLGRNPVAIGAWHEDGTPVPGYALNEAAWLDVAPDEIDDTDPDNPVATRPTAWRDIHGWGGWADKINTN